MKCPFCAWKQKDYEPWALQNHLATEHERELNALAARCQKCRGYLRRGGRGGTSALPMADAFLVHLMHEGGGESHLLAVSLGEPS
jgi:hypothetical protein